MSPCRLSLAFSFLLATPCAQAADGPLALTPIPANSSVDALNEDSVWENAQAFELPYSVIDRGTPRFRTVYKILYDQEAVYFEVTSFDDDMSTLREKYSLRDQPMSGDDDRITITLDPIGNRKFGQVFGVSSACVPFDAVIDEVNATLDTAPQFYFSAECRKFKDSWRARLKIPFTELKYKESPARMTLLVDRRFRRETQGLLTSSPIEYFGNCLLCEAHQIVLETPPKKTNYKAVVEAFGSHLEDEDGKDDHKNLGLSLSIPLTLGTVLDATWRPDYSQVEADTPYLSANSPFPIPRTENRPFFMEGNDILFAPFFTAAQSRAIVSPNFGVKLLSRHEQFKLFTLVAGDQDSVYRLAPGTYEADYVQARAASNNLMTRAVWNAGDALTLGMTVNAKRESDLHENTAWGPEIIWRLNQWHKVMAQALSSETEDAEDLGDGEEDPIPASKRTGRALGVGYSYSGDQLALGLNLYRIEKDFENDLGFMPENGIREASAYVDYSFQYKAPALALSDITMNAGISKKMEDDSLRVISTDVGSDVNFITDRWLTLTYGWAPVAGRRASSEGELHPGQRQKVAFSLRPPQFLSLFECKYVFGETLVYDEDKLGTNRKTSCRVAANFGLHVSGEYSQDLDRYLVKDNGHRLDERVQTATLRYFFNRADFLRVTVQSIVTSDFEDQYRELIATWLLGHQDITSLSAYLGVNQAVIRENEDEDRSVEYFAKISYAL